MSIVSLQFLKILCTIIADLIVVEIEFGKCLCQVKLMNMDEEEEKALRCLTLFCCNPSPRYSAPLSPI